MSWLDDLIPESRKKRKHNKTREAVSVLPKFNTDSELVRSLTSLTNVCSRTLSRCSRRQKTRSLMTS